METCPVCRAPNRVDAPWCSRCHTRLAERAAAADLPPLRPPRQVGAQNARGGFLVALTCGLIAWAALQVTGPARGVQAEAGTLDPRGFRFLAVEAGSLEPVRYDACQPIHYVVNPNLAPSSGMADIEAALERTSDATGLRFVYDGETDEVPSDIRQPYQPDRYGDRWAPLLIGWASGLTSDDGQAESAGTRIVGRAGSTYRANDQGHPVYVTGTVVFDATADLGPGFGGETWGQAMLHELAHVVGLDHVEDADSVMNPVMGLRPAAWGPSDREGLWELGLGRPCLSTPTLP